MKSLTKEKRYDLMLSIQLLDTWTIYSISIIFTLNGWFTKYILLNFNLTKLFASDTEAAFLHLPIHNDTVYTKIYDKRDDFDFDIVNFPFLDGDVPRRPSYGVYILSKKSSAQMGFLVNPVLARNGCF